MNFISYNINGPGLIDICYDGVTSFLEIDKEMIAVSIHGPYQDVCNSFFIRGDFNYSQVNSFLNQLNFDFYTDFDFLFEFTDLAKNVLQFFGTGSYHFEKANNFFIATTDSDYQLVMGDFDSLSHPLFFTRNTFTLSKTVVTKYKTEIENGSRPIIFSFRKDYGSETGESYLIDGHHKLMAYIELKIEAPIWEIVKYSQEEYNETDQVLCKYLNHKEIKETSLKYFYVFSEDDAGNIFELRTRR